MLQQEFRATVPGTTSTNRVYDPATPSSLWPCCRQILTAEGTGMKFEDTPTEELLQIKNVINSGMAKNKIDIQYPQSKTIPESRVHRYGKRVWEKIN
jgi:hypothetical protein